MKKIFAITTGTLLPFSLVLPVEAATVNPCATGVGGSFCNLNADKFGTVVNNVITFLIITAILIAVFFLVWGGIRWILSGGDKAKVEAARNSIIGAIIGLVIVFLAYFIASVVAKMFGVDISNLTIPSFG